MFFFQDCEDPNPLIRALAVRTMGCIRVDKITDYFCEPLRKCLKVCHKCSSTLIICQHQEINLSMQDFGHLNCALLVDTSNQSILLVTFEREASTLKENFRIESYQTST